MQKLKEEGFAHVATVSPRGSPIYLTQIPDRQPTVYCYVCGGEVIKVGSTDTPRARFSGHFGFNRRGPSRTKSQVGYEEWHNLVGERDVDVWIKHAGEFEFKGMRLAASLVEEARLIYLWRPPLNKRPSGFEL